MASAEELRELVLDEYGNHFDLWLVDLKKNLTYSWLVGGYEENWIEIYKALNRIFKETYWCQRKLMLTKEALTKEDDVWLTITNAQLDSYILRRYFTFLSPV